MVAIIIDQTIFFPFSSVGRLKVFKLKGLEFKTACDLQVILLQNHELDDKSGALQLSCIFDSCRIIARLIVTRN